MYRIYLADDNDLFRESLEQTIAWEEMSCVLAGSARDGETAEREILALRPDIVLLDIRMPGVSGLEIAAELSRREMDTRVIIVSGYGDFGYTQKSIRLGVFDYLLKPVDEHELRDVIARAIVDLEEKRGSEPSCGRIQPGDDGAPEPEIARRESSALLRSALEGNAAAAAQLNHIVTDRLCFVQYELLRICPDGTGIQEQNMEDWNHELCVLLDEIAASEEGAIMETVFSNALFVAFFFPKLEADRDCDISSLRLANMIYESAGEQHLNICLSISQCQKDLSGLQDAVRQTEFAYDSRFFIENRHVIHYDSLRSRSMSNLYPIMQRVEKLYDALRTAPAEVTEMLENVEKVCHEEQVFDPTVMRSIFVNMGIVMNMKLLDYSGQKKRNAEQDGGTGELIRKLNHSGSLDETFQILREIAVKIAVNAQDDRKNSVSAVTARILDYLEQNYAAHLELQDICDYVGLSQGHVCRILKNDTGETFINILNKIRVEKAREMLASHQYKVYEVAEAVGFTNYAYFYQTYRKYTGESPTKR
ncbi:MAG: response regulator [Lachnospiraceae bacterium]|nr:response regulator [Lachnospiraceae bacterium]